MDGELLVSAKLVGCSVTEGMVSTREEGCSFNFQCCGSVPVKRRLPQKVCCCKISRLLALNSRQEAIQFAFFHTKLSDQATPRTRKNGATYRIHLASIPNRHWKCEWERGGIVGTSCEGKGGVRQPPSERPERIAGIVFVPCVLNRCGV